MKYLAFTFLLFLSVNSYSQLRVAKIFSDNMVLQRDVKIPIWGWANKGEKIKMIFAGQSYYTNAANGKWEFTLPAKPAGKRYGILIQGKNEKIAFHNITYGDVWLCGGQSNMEWFVENATNGQDEVNNANNPNIRLFDVPHKIASKPLRDIEKGSWQVCSPKSVKQFSAVGYFFGRNLQEELKIPIGLISDNYGGTVIETWMSPDAFEDMPVYQKQIAQLSAEKAEKDQKETASKFKLWLENFASKDQGKKGTDYVWKDLDFAQAPTIELPNQWESSGIEAMKNLDGVVWFEREFILNKKQLAEKAELSLGPIDDSDITWINGKKVGETKNRWNKDRVYSVESGILKEGKNTIVVRVEDYLGGGGIYGKSSKLFIRFQNQKNIPLAGKWYYKIGYTTTEPMPSGGDFGPNSAPTLLYNGMIAPIQKFPIKGVIWYQGETNTYRAVEYKELKIKWIRNWRKLWNQSDMPIIWVQLANYQAPDKEPKESAWAELREAQQNALSEPHTAMITAIDLGSTTTIHPLNKQEVGRRLALAALEETYHQKTAYKSPRFLKIAKKKRKYIDLIFQDVDGGLVSQRANEPIAGFSIAGKDHVFHWAKAKIISDNKIRIYIPKHFKLMAVRYAWANNPQPADIYNKKGFPLLPFRTDNWKLSTQNITRP